MKLPRKPGAQGIRADALVCSVSHYVLEIIPYAGSAHMRLEKEVEGMSPTTNLLISTLFVLGFMEKGYRIFIDKYYSTVKLAEYLLERGTYVTGTIRDDRGPPPRMKAPSKDVPKSRRGESLWASRPVRAQARHGSGGAKRRLYLVRWADNRYVTCIFTGYLVVTGAMLFNIKRWSRAENEHKTYEQPLPHYEWNKKKLGVDVADQYAASIPFGVGRTGRWWVTTMFNGFCMQTCLINAHVIFNATRDNESEKLSYREFAYQVQKGLLAEAAQIRERASIAKRLEEARRRAKQRKAQRKNKWPRPRITAHSLKALRATRICITGRRTMRKTARLPVETASCVATKRNRIA